MPRQARVIVLCFAHYQLRLFSQEPRHYLSAASFIFFPPLSVRYARSARDLRTRPVGLPAKG